MRSWLVVAVLLVLTSVPRTWVSGSEGVNRLEWILPGRSIGNARLGMTAPEIRAANSRSVCQISVRYRNGRAIVLATDWGTMCQTRQGVQVALPFPAAVREFGPPKAVVHEVTYPDSVAVWVPYLAHGIAFRVLVMRGEQSTMIQAISVFIPGASVWRP